MGEQTNTVVNLRGGLDQVSTYYTQQARPGVAKVLENFEVSVEAGYRRINGFEKYYDSQPAGATQILGAYPYADGVVVVAGSNLYFMEYGGTTWYTLNRDTWTAKTGTVAVTNGSGTYIDVTGSGTAFTTEFTVGDYCRIDGNIRKIASITDNTTMTLDTEISGGVTAGEAIYKNGALITNTNTIQPRTNQGRCHFAWYEDQGDYGALVITDSTGTTDLTRIVISGSGAGRTVCYCTQNSTNLGAPDNPKLCTHFGDRIVVANSEQGAGRIDYSARLDNIDWYGGGSISISSPITAIYGFRDKLIIFSEHSIHQVVDLDNPEITSVLDISFTTGCINGFTVQEMAGDLVFLAPDGIRSLRASDQYGDVTFGIISSAIAPTVKALIRSNQTKDLSSAIVRDKNQYRLFYCSSGDDDTLQRGIIGTYKMQPETGGFGWEWSEVRSIPVACMSSEINFNFSTSKSEWVIHGGYDGYVYIHDSGSDFAGSAIDAKLTLHELDYGDVGVRKTLHYVRIFGETEGTSDTIDLNITYDPREVDGSTVNLAMQPDTYNITGINAGSTYGYALYGTAIYGGTPKWVRRQLVEGSGYSNEMEFYSTGTGDPYTLNSIYIDLRVGAKL